MGGWMEGGQTKGFQNAPHGGAVRTGGGGGGRWMCAGNRMAKAATVGRAVRWWRDVRRTDYCGVGGGAVWAARSID